MNELAKSLVKAQSAMNHAAKDAKNPHFKSAYSSLASVIDAVRPHLSANGLAFVQKLHNNDISVGVETVLIHESGQEMSCGILYIPVTKHDAQGLGSCVTYGKRYSLQAALGIASEDDDNNAASKAPVRTQSVAVTLDMDWAVDEMAACKTVDALKEKFGTFYKSCAADQKPVLKAMYDGIKTELEGK